MGESRKTVFIGLDVHKDAIAVAYAPGIAGSRRFGGASTVTFPMLAVICRGAQRCQGWRAATAWAASGARGC